MVSLKDRSNCAYSHITLSQQCIVVDPNQTKDLQEGGELIKS